MDRALCSGQSTKLSSDGSRNGTQPERRNFLLEDRATVFDYFREVESTNVRYRFSKGGMRDAWCHRMFPIKLDVRKTFETSMLPT